MIAIMWQTWLTVLWNCLLVLPFAGHTMAATGQQNCYSTLDCNFESNSLCSWINVQSNDDFDWTLHKLTTPSDNTGPNADHTHGNSQGTYIYIESSAPRLSGEAATLQSQVVKPHGRGSVTLTFWYNMYGNSIGQLSVYVLPTINMTSFPGIRVWSLSGDQGKAWHHANITFDYTGEFHVLIEGTVEMDFG
ncbi:MAM and LDL-receptor class A domain-containing protein 1-like [Mya arenaria]|uniref:MAM and LDL-receptor class A domain-containing protein 1-like n=1 Tax=Mya arenaria TaxID=6604 RepID=UPI0022E541FA|nr:MAM and LDL-receptor class A domain-containing protein 1-like [Mya arenaria]